MHWQSVGERGEGEGEGDQHNRAHRSQAESTEPGARFLFADDDNLFIGLRELLRKKYERMWKKSDFYIRYSENMEGGEENQ